MARLTGLTSVFLATKTPLFGLQLMKRRLVQKVVTDPSKATTWNKVDEQSGTLCWQVSSSSPALGLTQPEQCAKQWLSKAPRQAQSAIILHTAGVQVQFRRTTARSPTRCPHVLPILRWPSQKNSHDMVPSDRLVCTAWYSPTPPRSLGRVGLLWGSRL